MKHFRIAALTCFCAIAMSCNENSTEKAAPADADTAQIVTATADPAKLKKEIQDLETGWAAADNAGDVNALAAFYADDAVSLATDQPMIVGNDAIKKDLEAAMAKKPKGQKVSYEVMDVFGSGNYVTEVGKTIRTDSTGKVTSTGKYMAVWEKRNGKWICIRDMGNNDAKVK